MHVGFDIRPALFGNAGIARYARELGRCLTAMPDGPFLEMFAPTWKGGTVTTASFTTGRYHMHRGILPARGMQLINCIPGLDAGRWPAKVDVFHWTDYMYPKVTSAARVMTLHDAAFAVDPTFHGWNTSTLLDRVRNAIDQAEIIIVVSVPGMADAELLGADPERVRVIPNGVSSIFKPSAPGAERVNRNKFVLTVGTIEPRKNYPRILRALENLWDKDMAPDWIIVGKAGWDHADFLNSLETSRHRKRIRWVKDASDHELVLLYQECEALVYPSLHEGFGLPVLESMACGKPVVVGDKTAPAWVAGDGGMRVQPNSVDSIQAGIERILCETDWTRQASAVLQKRAEEFRWNKAAVKTLAAYRDAIQAFSERRVAVTG